MAKIIQKYDKKIFNKSFLSSGKDLIISDSVKVRHPSMGDILTLNDGIQCDNVYWSYVSFILCNPYENAIWLDDLGLNYLKVTPFDILLYKWNEAIEDYKTNKDEYDSKGINPLSFIIEPLKFFLGKEHDFTIGKISGTEEFVLVDKNDDKYLIGANDFYIISKFIQEINCISFSSQMHPHTESARKMVITRMREEVEYKQRFHKNDEDENKDVIGSMMNAVMYGGNGGINPFNINDIKIYQLYAAFSIIQKHDLSHNLYSGIYHGTLKADSVGEEELDWAR